MELFELTQRARVDRVIPKNAFDGYTNSRQKKLFVSLISRITWLFKLSPDTINLKVGDINEIQIFRVEAKVREEVQEILNVIDKAIPYTIIFMVEYRDEIYLSTSVKHSNPANADKAVIDYTFTSPWFSKEEQKYQLKLQKSLDAVYQDLCIQLSNQSKMFNQSLNDLVQFRQRQDFYEKEIERLKTSIKNCKQYKSKVELNLELNQKIGELKKLTSS